jgi:hypothetical protein
MFLENEIRRQKKKRLAGKFDVHHAARRCAACEDVVEHQADETPVERQRERESARAREAEVMRSRRMP